MSISTAMPPTSDGGNIVVLLKETVYDCFVNMQGFRDLEEGNELETDLLDKETKEPLGKKVSLRVDRLLSGEADVNMVLEDASFDTAEKVRLTITGSVYQSIRRAGGGGGRWAYGDVFVFIRNDLDKYRDRT